MSKIRSNYEKVFTEKSMYMYHTKNTIEMNRMSTHRNVNEAIYLIDKKLSRGGYDASYMKVHVLLNICVFLGQLLIHVYVHEWCTCFLFIYSLSHQIQQFLHTAISKISNLRINHWINFYSFNEIDVYLRYVLNGYIISVSRAKKKNCLWTFCPPPLYFSGLHVCLPVNITYRFVFLEKRRAFCNDEHNVTADKT